MVLLRLTGTIDKKIYQDNRLEIALMEAKIFELFKTGEKLKKENDALRERFNKKYPDEVTFVRPVMKVKYSSSFNGILTHFKCANLKLMPVVLFSFFGCDWFRRVSAAGTAIFFMQ